MDAIAANWNAVLDFLQAVTVKVPRVADHPCPWVRKSTQGTCSGEVLHTMSYQSQPPSLLHHSITWKSQNYWATLQYGFKTHKPSAQSFWCSVNLVEIQRERTDSLQNNNASYWRRSHWTTSTFCWHHHSQSTASPTCTTQLIYKRILLWPN